MNKEIEKEDSLVELEGIIEIPNVRVRNFDNIQDLANWLFISRPKSIKVETGMSNGVKIFRLISYV